MAAAFDFADHGRRRPFAFLRRDRDFAMRSHGHAVRVSKARRQQLGALPVRAHPMRSNGIDVIKVALRVHVEAGHVIVPVFGRLNAAVKVLVIIRFIIAVAIVQGRDLVTPKHMHDVAADLQPERLEQPGGKAFPRDILQLLVNAAHQPNVPVQRAHRRIPVVEEIDAGNEHQRFVCIVVRHGNGIDHIRAGVRRALSLHFELLRPERLRF